MKLENEKEFLYLLAGQIDFYLEEIEMKLAELELEYEAMRSWQELVIEMLSELDGES